MKHYIGDFRKDAKEGSHGGWLIGSFMKQIPQKNTNVEIKYWEYEIGPTIHDSKISGIFECTFILEGEISGFIGEEKIELKSGQYIAIPAGVQNNIVQSVQKKVKGLTIKAPSKPNPKKVIVPSLT